MINIYNIQRDIIAYICKNLLIEIQRPVVFFVRLTLLPSQAAALEFCLVILSLGRIKNLLMQVSKSALK